MTIWPQGYSENMKWRIKLLQKCAKDDIFAQKIKEYFFEDILFAFNAFFFTLDVRRKPYHHRPFITYPYQDEIILQIRDCIQKGEDLLIEKSRDMGVTWMVLLTYLHFWLNPAGGVDFLLGSRTEKYVDKTGDNRTLFEKLRYALYFLPRFLRPAGFRKDKHDNFLELKNPYTRATITGESNNPSFSTAGRYTSVFFDEFGKWETTDKLAWTAAGDATPCRIAVSTPNGAAGHFYELRSTQIKKIICHWHLHPYKGLHATCPWPRPPKTYGFDLITSPWFENEKKRRTKYEIAQELQIQYLGGGRVVLTDEAGKSLLEYLDAPEVRPFYYDLVERRFIPEARFADDVLHIYALYNPEHQYIIAADVAEGLPDGDYSAVIVLNRITFNVDAVYHQRVNESDLAERILDIAALYTGKDETLAPYVAIETNSMGKATFNRVEEAGYSRLFMMPRYDISRQQISYRKGWITSPQSRPALISAIREYLTFRAGELNYKPLIRELTIFAYDKFGKPQAPAGEHDDLVMAFGIAVAVHEILPLDKIEKPAKQGVTTNVINLDDYRIEEETSLSARCLQSVLRKRKEITHVW